MEMEMEKQKIAEEEHSIILQERLGGSWEPDRQRVV